METRWTRLAPLLGVVFVVLLGIDFAVGGNEPGPGASAAKVISWYGAHRSRVRISEYLFAVVLVLGLLFYGYLRDRLAEGSRGLAATAFGGAILFAVSGAVGSGVELALADDPARLSLATAHALNLVNDYVATIAVAAGAAALLIAASLAILRGRQLPEWIAWLGLVFGVAALVPVRNVGPIPAGIWNLIVSIVLFIRGRQTSPVSRTATAPGVPSGAR